jgi:hypothetical protein
VSLHLNVPVYLTVIVSLHLNVTVTVYEIVTVTATVTVHLTVSGRASAALHRWAMANRGRGRAAARVTSHEAHYLVSTAAGTGPFGPRTPSHIV